MSNELLEINNQELLENLDTMQGQLNTATHRIAHLEAQEKRYLKLLRALGEWHNETADKSTELKLQQILNNK